MAVVQNSPVRVVHVFQPTVAVHDVNRPVPNNNRDLLPLEGINVLINDASSITWVLHQKLIEAIKLVESGVTTVEDIDKGMRLGFGRPMGPFETGDMAGLDVGYNAMLTVYRETRDPKFHPPMLLQRKVKLGQLGRKTGIGWYRYDENGKKLGPA